MKIFVKTLKGSNFEIEVKPEDSVADVKKIIETSQGSAVYPASQQMLIHQGKELKDGTLDKNKVAENSFVVIMLTKSKSSPGEVSDSSTAGTPKASQPSAPSTATTATVTATKAPIQPATVTTPPPVSSATTDSASDPYGLAASDRVAGTNLEGTVQQILDMGGGIWDRVTVQRALRSAFNNPARAIDYLYSGIPQQPEAPPAARIPVRGEVANLPAQPPQSAQPASTFSSGPNANPLNLFPQGLPNVGAAAAGAGTLDFLRDSQQFQGLRALVRANPQILQPMLQELGIQNPNLRRLISQNRADFLRLINEPEEGREGNILGDAIMHVTPEERAAVERLEAMGFNRAIVMEVFFACNKNEELAANYLLDHMHEFDD